ncbi:hypothetical protein [Luteimonas aquatica]|uniref:hypothetical protein n=1 Tax=Luteimonas aquatica TaxID=450364 RepID=UPI001F59C205|nr:hypothetical protein [Luteimonas aquatica]
MQVRKQPIGQAFAWIRQAINLGTRNPRAIFGASLLMMATLYLAVTVMMLPASMVLQSGGDITAALIWGAPAYVAMNLLLPVLMGGLMHVIREAEAGRPVRARDLFAPFRKGGAGQLGLLGGAQLLFGLLGSLIAAALAGTEYWKDYLEVMRVAMGGAVPDVMPRPEHPGLMTLVQMAFNYFNFALILFGIPLILFSRLRLAEAVRAAVRAALANFSANFLAGLIFVGGALVLTVVSAGVALLAMGLGALLHPAVGNLLAVLVLIALGSVLLVVLTGAGYFAWRDTFGDDGAAAPQGRGDGRVGIEV